LVDEHVSAFDLEHNAIREVIEHGVPELIPAHLEPIRVVADEGKATLNVVEETMPKTLALLIVPDGCSRVLTHRNLADVQPETHSPSASRAIRIASSIDT
jgi:hypothetical protein